MLQVALPWHIQCPCRCTHLDGCCCLLLALQLLADRHTTPEGLELDDLLHLLLLLAAQLSKPALEEPGAHTALDDGCSIDPALQVGPSSTCGSTHGVITPVTQLCLSTGCYRW